MSKHEDRQLKVQELMREVRMTPRTSFSFLEPEYMPPRPPGVSRYEYLRELIRRATEPVDPGHSASP